MDREPRRGTGEKGNAREEAREETRERARSRSLEERARKGKVVVLIRTTYSSLHAADYRPHSFVLPSNARTCVVFQPPLRPLSGSFRDEECFGRNGAALSQLTIALR